MNHPATCICSGRGHVAGVAPESRGRPTLYPCPGPATCPVCGEPILDEGHLDRCERAFHGPAHFNRHCRREDW